MKTKTLTFNERDHNIVVDVLKEKLDKLIKESASKDSIADIKFILSYINSNLWKE